MLEILKFPNYLVYFQQEQEFYSVSSSLFLVICKHFFIFLVAKENTRVKPALAIRAEAPITFAKEIIDTPPFVAEKTIK